MLRRASDSSPDPALPSAMKSRGSVWVSPPSAKSADTKRDTKLACTAVGKCSCADKTPSDGVAQGDVRHADVGGKLLSPMFDRKTVIAALKVIDAQIEIVSLASNIFDFEVTKSPYKPRALGRR